LTGVPVGDPQKEQLEAITRDTHQDHSQRQRLSTGSSTPQLPKLDGDLAAVAAAVPFYVLFLAVMAVAGLFRLDVPAGRAIVFTGATPNSLVVLPVALALPDALAIAALMLCLAASVQRERRAGQ
jgi:hypothetical protein